MFLAVVMVLSLLPAAAFAAEDTEDIKIAVYADEQSAELERSPLEALQAALEEGAASFTLTGNVTVTETLNISGEMELDLGGYTITDAVIGGPALNIDGGETGNVTIMNGSIVSTAEATGSAVTVMSGFVAVRSLFIDTSASNGGAGSWGENTGVRMEGGSLYVSEDARILSNQVGVIVLKDSVLDVYGTVETISSVDGDGYAAISGNGLAENAGVYGTQVNINNGATVTGVNMAIYQPQMGNLSIGGGTVTGGTAIGVKSGNVNIYGGTVIGTQTRVADPGTNNDGINSDGSAILVERNGAYAGNVNISISGEDTVLKSVNGNIIREIGSVGEDEQKTYVSISSGKMLAADGVDVLSLLSYDMNYVNLNGGYFSSDVSKYLPDYMIQENGEVVSAYVAYLNGEAYSTLQAAVDALADAPEWSDATIYVTRNVTLAQPLLIGEDVTLELSGYTISSAGEVLNITDGNVTVNNGTVKTTGKIAVRVQGDSAFTLNQQAIVTSPAHGILLRDAGGKAPTVNVYGTVEAMYAIQGNGLDRAGSTINIESGAQVLGSVVGIYHPQMGTLNINGGEVRGQSAIGIKSGTLNITGGKIIATMEGEYEDVATNTNGINLEGSAIVVDSNSAYPGEMNIVISGWDVTMESKIGYAIREIGADENTSNIVSLTITAGQFTAGQEEAIRLQTAAEENIAISGGTFDGKVAPAYFAEGYCQKENGIVSAHTVVYDQEEFPSCTEPGKTEGSHCSDCGMIIEKQEIVPATDHHFVDSEAKEATCTENGYTAGRCCEYCGLIDKDVETIPATGHTVVIDPAREATCSSPGLTEGKHCSVCLMVIETQKRLPTKAHTLVIDPAQEPTCAERGWTEGSHCSVCNKVIKEPQPIPVVPHTPVVDPAIKPTCSAPGWTEGSHCSECNKTIILQTQIPKLPHTSVVDPAVAATCTEDGLTEGSHCSVCNTVIVAQETIPATGHTEVVDEAVAPTCTEDGLTAGSHCSECGTVIVAQEVIPATGHDWDKGVITTEPTYTAAGVRTFTCNNCGETRTEAIPALTPPPGGDGSGSIGGGSTEIVDTDVPLAGILPFDDVAESDYFYEAVKYVYDNELMSGTSDITFNPYMDTTRGMIITILYRLAGEPAVTGTSEFADVTTDAYYHDAVVWATANNIIAGYGDGNFGSHDTITREQFAAILYRYVQLQGGGFTGTWAFPLDFTDADMVSDWAYEALCWMTMNSIINGMGDGTVSPNTGTSRAQAAVVLKNFCETLEK